MEHKSFDTKSQYQIELQETGRTHIAMSLTNVWLLKLKHGAARNNGCIAISEIDAFSQQTKTRNLRN
jgi:hypothetical protein